MMSNQNIDKFIESDGLDSSREQEIGQHIGYRYDVNLVPDMDRCTDFLVKYMDIMGWRDLNWLEDVHMGYEEGKPAVFDRNIHIVDSVNDGFIVFINENHNWINIRKCTNEAFKIISGSNFINLNLVFICNLR